MACAAWRRLGGAAASDVAEHLPGGRRSRSSQRGRGRATSAPATTWSTARPATVAAPRPQLGAAVACAGRRASRPGRRCGRRLSSARWSPRMPTWSPRSSPQVAAAASWAPARTAASLARATRATSASSSPMPASAATEPTASCTSRSAASSGANGSTQGTIESAASVSARTCGEVVRARLRASLGARGQRRRRCRPARASELAARSTAASVMVRWSASAWSDVGARPPAGTADRVRSPWRASTASATAATSSAAATARSASAGPVAPLEGLGHGHGEQEHERDGDDRDRVASARSACAAWSSLLPRPRPCERARPPGDRPTVRHLEPVPGRLAPWTPAGC